MKKYIFILIACFVAGSRIAQTSQRLSTDRNAYRADDQIVKQQVEYRDPGSSGRALFWDFSMLQPINEKYTLNYSIPDSSLMTRLCGTEHNTRYYYLQQHDSLWATGFENSTTLMEYLVPELRMKFPYSYGDTLFSFFSGNGEYCHRLPLKVKGYTRTLADAEGDLLLPQRTTVKKALRVHSLRHYTETGKDSVEMTLDTYSWYAAGIRYPVFESVKTIVSKCLKKQTEYQAASTKDTTVFTTSFYYPPELQTSQVQTDSIPVDQTNALQGVSAVFTEAQLMPNPVLDNLYLTYKLTRPAQVWFTVHNNTGIPLCQTAPQNQNEGYNNTTINMGGLLTGVYSLYVHVDDMVMKLNVVKK